MFVVLRNTYNKVKNGKGNKQKICFLERHPA